MSKANTPGTLPSPEEGGRKRLPRSAAPSPDNPPLLEEVDLNSAEEKVLKAFREDWEAGRRLIVVHPDGAEPIKDLATKGALTAKEPTAEDWQGAILRASFLRSLFLGSYDKFAPRSVIISCARIEGRLDLDYCEICIPLNFLWCIFPESISLRAATIPELTLTKCLIDRDIQGSSLSATQMQVTTNVSLNGKFIASGKVVLNGANIGGQLSCDGGHFEKGLTAQGLKTGEDVLLRAGFKSKGVVDLNGANVGGQLDCHDGRFEEGLIAQSLKTGKDVLLSEGFKSNGEVYLKGANISGEFSCTGGYFKKGLTALNMKTIEGVFLREGFESSGEVDLLGADIGGQLDCHDGCFKEGLIAQGMKTGKDVFMTGEFESNGKVRLLSADIDGHFLCTGGYFQEGLAAQNLKVGKDMFLSEGFRSGGEVNLNGASIGGQLDCHGGHFEMGLNAQNLKTGEDVLLSKKFKSDGLVDLLVADIGERLDCSGGRFEKGLDANGLRYQWIELGGDWKMGLTWLNTMQEPEKAFFSQPYEQLMTAYRRMGKPDWAREIGFELEKKRHERSKGGWRAWYSILNWTIGYGYKPFRSLGWTVGLVMTGFLLFSSGHDGIVSRFAPQSLKTPAFLDNTFLANEWIPLEGEALKHWEKTSQTRGKGQAPQDYPKFNPFIYSLESTFPVLPLGQLDKWHPKNTFLRAVRWIWIFTGSALLAILALFGVGFLGPNRKSESDSS